MSYGAAAWKDTQREVIGVRPIAWKACEGADRGVLRREQQTPREAERHKKMGQPYPARSLA